MEPDSQIIAILRGITPGDAVEQIGCLLAHGICDIEIPTNSPEWSVSIQNAKAVFGEAINLGAGTILTVEQAILAAQMGARFILTPNLNPAVIQAAKKSGLSVCAGVFTSSEIFTAIELGVDCLKIFPAGALPVNYPQMIKGPLSQESHFSAVGGITIDNARQYLRYYNSVGIGSSLYRAGQTVDITAGNCLKLFAN